MKHVISSISTHNSFWFILFPFQSWEHNAPKKKKNAMISPRNNTNKWQSLDKNSKFLTSNWKLGKSDFCSSNILPCYSDSVKWQFTALVRRMCVCVCFERRADHTVVTLMIIEILHFYSVYVYEKKFPNS